MADNANAGDSGALEAKVTELDTRAKRFEGLLATAEKDLAKFKGLDIEKLKADSEALTQLQHERAQNKPEELKAFREAEREKIRKEFAPKLEEYETENKKLKGSLHEHLIVDKALTTVGAKFNEDAHIFVKDMIRRSMDRDEQGNIVVKDEQGNVRYSRAKPTEKLGLEEWAEEIASKHPSIAKPTVTSGSKSAGQVKLPSGGGVLDVASYIKMTPEQRAKIDPKDRGALATAAAGQIRLGGPR